MRDASPAGFSCSSLIQDFTLADILLHLHAWVHPKDPANQHGCNLATYLDITSDRAWLWWAGGTHIAALHASSHVFIDGFNVIYWCDVVLCDKLLADVLSCLVVFLWYNVMWWILVQRAVLLWDVFWCIVLWCTVKNWHIISFSEIYCYNASFLRPSCRCIWAKESEARWIVWTMRAAMKSIHALEMALGAGDKFSLDFPI